MGANPNTNYSFNPWMKFQRPGYWSFEDQRTQEALLADFSATAEEIRLIRPPVGNVPFPPRFGYEKRQPTLMDVLTIGPTTLMHDTATRQESGQPGSSGPSLAGW
jgi:hypothetical protein